MYLRWHWPCWLFRHSSVSQASFPSAEEGLYPGYLVALTSAVGWFLTHRLESEGRLGPWAGWFTTCLYTAKLSLLVLITPGVLWPSVLLAATVTPPMLLYRDKSRPQLRGKMKPWQVRVLIDFRLEFLFIAGGICFGRAWL